jgi:hypothetical protein
MPKAIKISLIVLSVALNAAFIGAWGLNRLGSCLSCGTHGKSALKEDQRDNFFDIIRQRSACDGHSPIMMGLET